MLIEKNNIYNVNCFDGFKSLNDKSISHILTSPPYNRKRNDKYEHFNDININYFDFLTNILDESLRVTKGYVFFNIMKNYYNKKDVFKLIGHYSEKIVEIIIWGKTNPLPASGHSITNSYEFFLVLSDEPLKSNTTYTKNLINTSINNKTSKEHKAIMKQEVADWVIEKFTKEGDLILDPLMGTGTTAISCLKYGRDFIGFELVGNYVELANERINNFKNKNGE